MYADIVRAEAGVIQNRLKKTAEKLLKENDIETNSEKYYLLKKCLNLEKKNFARDLNNEINNDLEYLNENYIQNSLKNSFVLFCLDQKFMTLFVTHSITIRNGVNCHMDFR